MFIVLHVHDMFDVSTTSVKTWKDREIETMGGCMSSSSIGSKEDLAAANLRAMEKNMKQGKDRLGNTGFGPHSKMYNSQNLTQNSVFSGMSTVGIVAIGSGCGGC